MNAISVENQGDECSATEPARLVPSRPDEEECPSAPFVEDTGLSEIRQLAVALGLAEIDDFTSWDHVQADE
ncbi:MAG TPA: hypothetical protein PK184_00320 [Phycisphaerae bacterium]|jgi:hypothetical protein|nr:hypothetical protein [Phycisphaerae bacterium]